MYSVNALNIPVTIKTKQKHIHKFTTLMHIHRVAFLSGRELVKVFIHSRNVGIPLTGCNTATM